jgi:hypothetical protein
MLLKEITEMRRFMTALIAVAIAGSMTGLTHVDSFSGRLAITQTVSDNVNDVRAYATDDQKMVSLIGFFAPICPEGEICEAPEPKIIATGGK